MPKIGQGGGQAGQAGRQRRGTKSSFAQTRAKTGYNTIEPLASCHLPFGHLAISALLTRCLRNGADLSLFFAY